MLKAIFESILSVFVRMFERLYRESKTAQDADSNPDLLRRSGSRINEWMRKSGVGPRK
jgi:hypothetical protein